MAEVTVRGGWPSVHGNFLNADACLLVPLRTCNEHHTNPVANMKLKRAKVRDRIWLVMPYCTRN